VGGDDLPDFQAMAIVSPVDSGKIYALQNHFFASNDRGATWQIPVPMFCCWFDGDLAVHPADSQTFYMAIVGSSQPGATDGIYKSSNGGLNWLAINTGLPSPAQFHTLAVDPQNGNTVFAERPARAPCRPASTAPSTAAPTGCR